MHSSFESLKDVFNTHPGLSTVRSVVKQSEIIEKFYDVFPELEKTARPVTVKKRVLLLKAENPVLRNELRLNEEMVGAANAEHEKNCTTRFTRTKILNVLIVFILLFLFYFLGSTTLVQDKKLIYF